MNSTPVRRFELSALRLGGSLGKGGQGQVTEVKNVTLNKQWPGVLKQYSPEVKHKLRVTALETIAGFPRTLAHRDGSWLHESTAWPVAVVEDHGVVCGFLMRTVPSAYYFSFQTQTKGAQRKLADMAFLLNPDQYVSSSGIAISDRDRLMLLGSVAAVLSRLHALEVIVGDLSPKNLLFSLTPAPSCFLIDCDAVRLSGYTVLDQVETPDWEVPADEPKATAATDAFKFGLLAIRLFGRDQSSRDTAALARISSELGRLAGLSQHRDPRQRPPPGTWVTALDAAALTASATTAPRATAPQSGPTPPWISGRPFAYSTTGRPAAAATPPKPTRRRAGGPLTLAACVAVIAAVIGLLVHDTLGSGGSAGIGDSCLVGTWRGGEGHTYTKVNGQLVEMHGGAGDIDHISANGTDEKTWGAKSKPLYGTYQGHTVKEIIRGHNTLMIHATESSHKLSLAEDGWSTGSNATFIYEGHTSSGHLSQVGTTSYSYECTAHKLKWRNNNRTIDRETRISRTP